MYKGEGLEGERRQWWQYGDGSYLGWGLALNWVIVRCRGLSCRDISLTKGIKDRGTMLGEGDIGENGVNQER